MQRRLLPSSSAQQHAKGFAADATHFVRHDEQPCCKGCSTVFIREGGSHIIMWVSAAIDSWHTSSPGLPDKSFNSNVMRQLSTRQASFNSYPLPPFRLFNCRMTADKKMPQTLTLWKASEL
jgi:hypothetical protein